MYDPLVVLWALVDDALSGNLSLEAQVERLAAVSGRELSAGSGALCRARQRQPVALMRACAEHVARVAAGFQRNAGSWVDYAVDGSYTALLDSPANQERDPQSACQRAGCGWPLLHAVALVDQGTGCSVAMSLGGLGDHDAKLARPLWDRLARGDRVVMDRGFASYGMLTAAQRRGWTVVMRQHQRRLNSEPLTGDGDDRLETWSVPNKRPDWWDAQRPARQAVRVVRQRRRDGTQHQRWRGAVEPRRGAGPVRAALAHRDALPRTQALPGHRASVRAPTVPAAA
ncbi:MAG: transposase [Armatimonadetes bacterium]|nr:transposase [Armatimonadota bacterium]